MRERANIEEKRAAIGRAVFAYYNSLTEQELAEENAWAEFAMSEMSEWCED